MLQEGDTKGCDQIKTWKNQSDICRQCLPPRPKDVEVVLECQSSSVTGRLRNHGYGDVPLRPTGEFTPKQYLR